MENGERKVRHADVGMADIAGVARAVQDMYDDRLDVLIVRGALDATRLAALGEQLDRDDRDPGWARPNQRMPVEDIQLLGTDTPATPTYQSPRGASLDDYLQSAERNKSTTTALFGEGYNPVEAFRRVLGQVSGGLPVEVPAASDGRTYVPFTIRRLVAGRQIGAHHDYHYYGHWRQCRQLQRDAGGW